MRMDVENLGCLQFDLLIKHGYQPFRGLGSKEDGILEPIVPARHVEGTSLGFTGQSFGRKTTFVKGAQ